MVGALLFVAGGSFLASVIFFQFMKKLSARHPPDGDDVWFFFCFFWEVSGGTCMGASAPPLTGDHLFSLCVPVCIFSRWHGLGRYVRTSRAFFRCVRVMYGVIICCIYFGFIFYFCFQLASHFFLRILMGGSYCDHGNRPCLLDQ